MGFHHHQLHSYGSAGDSVSKSEILYKDIAVGADENAVVTSGSAQDFSDVTRLPFGADSVRIATLEANHWLLDGTFQMIDPWTPGFWSATMSDENGLFENPPEIDISFSKQFSSTGITLAFDTAANNWPIRVNIKWYQQSELKSDMDFTPDAATYFCVNKVESYDRVVITILETDYPYRYAKLEQVIFGTLRRFGMNKLRKAQIVNEMSLLSSELPVSKLDWTLDDRDDVDYLFQLKQPIEVSNDGRLIGVYYIDEADRVTKSIYDIGCYDAIGVLDESPFSGGVYTDKSAVALLNEIVGDAFGLVIEVEDTTVTGIIKAGSKRSALQQLLFAWGACASTDGSASIRIFNPPTDSIEVGKVRTFPNVKVNTSAIVTEVHVYAHTYAKADNGSVTINGVKYSDTETLFTVTNPDVTAVDKANVKEVKSATLVSPAIGQAVAQRVYDYYARRNTITGTIVWDGEHLGDSVTIPNSWGTDSIGNLTKMTVKLSNTVVYNGTARGI